MANSLSMLIYGNTKVGKSTLAATAPYPRLFLDSESAARFLPFRSIKWDPLKEDPPTPDGTWDTCVVDCRDYATYLRVEQWLKLGRHQFKSVILDSLSELQVKCLEQIAGRDQVKMQEYGELARKFTGMMRDLRDLTTHPTNPLDAVILTAMTTEKDGMWGPFLTGQSKTVAPYLFDVLGALVVEEFANPDPTQPPLKYRRMHIDQHPKYLAGSRVTGQLGPVVEQGDLNIEAMIHRVYGTVPSDTNETE